MLSIRHGADSPDIFGAEGATGPNGLVVEVGLLASTKVGAEKQGGNDCQSATAFDKFHSHLKEGVLVSGYF